MAEGPIEEGLVLIAEIEKYAQKFARTFYSEADEPKINAILDKIQDAVENEPMGYTFLAACAQAQGLLQGFVDKAIEAKAKRLGTSHEHSSDAVN